MSEEIVKDIPVENLERRFVPLAEIELRAGEGDTPVIEGYAAVFNKWGSEAYGFREKIAPGAFKKTIKGGDVRALFNHDPNHVLGRQSNGTLTLKEDDRGLSMHTDINADDPDAMSVYAKVRRGDVNGQSFGFVVREEEWKYFDDDTKLPERIIREVDLFDVGPVTFPFYEQTDVTVALRSLERNRPQNDDDDKTDTRELLNAIGSLPAENLAELRDAINTRLESINPGTVPTPAQDDNPDDEPTPTLDARRIAQLRRIWNRKRKTEKA